MARPVKWSRDIHTIRERAERSRIETWSRQDIEHLFGGSRPAGHFVDCGSLLGFLDAMIGVDSVESALQARMAEAAPPPVKGVARFPARRPPPCHAA